MREKPPCKTDGVECQMRYIGCRNDCEAYRKWQERHIAARERKNRAKGEAIAVDTFLATQGQRTKTARHRDYMREHMKGR